jgi:hypothetical protein
MAQPAVYTPEQADNVLPLVRAIVEDQRDVYLRLRRNLTAFRSVEDLEDVSGDHGLPVGMRDDLAELRGLLLELKELGVNVEDPEIGLVTLRGLYRGEVVNLCWKLGEDRVRFWYPEGGCYAARLPLDAACGDAPAQARARA